jgi:endonuclease YncB( thermonuclease family)
MMRLIIAAFMMIAVPVAVDAKDWPERLSGKPSRIVDGDTLHLDGHKIRLLGIDTPEMKQYCHDRDDVAYPCGERARDRLADMIGSADGVDCMIAGRDRYKRLLGQCFAGGVDLQEALIAEGLGVAEYTDDYREAEEEARRRKLGMWAGKFQRPRDYRKSN